MNNISYDKVILTGGILAHMQKLNEDVTMRSVYCRFEETGRFEALKCRWNEGEPNKPHVFWDSDVAKWIEAAAYILKKKEDPWLEGIVEASIDELEANAMDDGYVNSYFTRVEPDKRFTRRDWHELYCCGHLIEAAVAYYEATGRDRFLKLMCRYADLIDRIFRVEKSAAFDTPGHEEIELALFRLARVTGQKKYAELARFFVDERGNSDRDDVKFADIPNAFTEIRNARTYHQDYPVRQQDKAIGHSVRNIYLAIAMADYSLYFGDEDLHGTCRRLFEDITRRKMYVTGGIGSSAERECFTYAYDLPNSRAYTETCAGISLMLFCERLLRMEWKSQYADTVERVMYNGFLSGISLDGKGFFYENPLEIDLENNRRLNDGKHGEHFPITERVEVFSCSCCPPNVNRILASIGQFMFASDGRKLCVHQYADCKARFDGMKISVSTKYPADGEIVIRSEGAEELYLRIPGWCRSFTLSQKYEMQDGYAVVKNPEEKVVLSLDMPVMAVYPNSCIREDAGRTAVSRGPVVYCAESGDNGKKLLNNLSIKRPLESEIEASDFNGIPTLSVAGVLRSTSDELYSFELPEEKSVRIRLIPYFAFANRGSDNMQVWLREK